MHRRTLEEAAAIAGEHLTPADKVERAFRDARIAKAAAQRMYEEWHEKRRAQIRRASAENALLPPLELPPHRGGIDLRECLERRLVTALGCGGSIVYDGGMRRVSHLSFTCDDEEVRIPPWANWLAVTSEGCVVVYFSRPHVVVNYWEGNPMFLASVQPRTDWRDTLCPLTEVAWKEWRINEC